MINPTTMISLLIAIAFVLLVGGFCAKHATD